MSNYGPKKLKLYNTNDNLKRKSSRTSEELELGPNSMVRSYSTKPGQLSSKSQAEADTKRYARLNKKQPVKVFSKEEIEAIYGRVA